MKWFEKEDSQAIFISLLIIIFISILWMFNLNYIYNFIDIKFVAWNFNNFFEKMKYFSISNLILFFIFFLLCFSIAFFFLKYDIKKHLVSFSAIFLLSIFTNFISSHELIKLWQLEAPLIALIIGLILNNIFQLPAWLKNNLLTEFYVKIGIILMGATLPLTLLIEAGFIAILQACIVTIVTFFLYFSYLQSFFISIQVLEQP